MNIPNCVPEYYREMQEREERAYERECKRLEYYEESKRKLKWARRLGYPVLLYGGYDECHHCKKKFDLQTDAEDDMCALVCYNKGCACHKKGDIDNGAFKDIKRK